MKMTLRSKGQSIVTTFWGISFLLSCVAYNYIAQDFPKSTKYKYYEKYMHVKEFDLIADGSKSVMQIRGGKSSFKVGETLNVFIQLKDKTGRRIREGGDILRIWLKEGNSNVNGDIIDHGDGSYTGSVLIPWVGQPTVYVSIANTRQQIRHVMDTINKFGILYELEAQFLNKENESAVLPSGPLAVEYWKETCNLTSLNYNVPWFSKKPVNTNLTCKDWKFLNYNLKPNIDKNKHEWIRTHKHTRLQENITITATGDDNVIQSSKRNCNNIDRRLTWKQNSPSGFYYNGTFVQSWCDTNITKSRDDYCKCLSNRHLLLIGDSNVRSFASYLLTFLNLSTHTGIPKTKPLEKFVYMERKDWNLSVSWAAHETPFYARPFYSKEHLKPSFLRLDKIPSWNNSIVVLHLFSHFARTSLAVFRWHIKHLRNSVENLLKRAPNVDIVIKGPHASTYFEIIEPSDYFAQIHWKIWQEEFKGLYHKVIYLDFWDMTTGIESIHMHPDDAVLSDMMLTFFSFLCKQEAHGP